MLSKKFLQEVNERPRGRGWAPLVALGALAVAAVAGFLVSWSVAGGVLVVGLGAAFVLHRNHAASQTRKVIYELGGDRRMAEHFACVGKACEILSASEKVWRRYNPGDSPGKPAASEKRTMVRVGRLEKPGIETNVEVWGMDSGETAVYFFPEAVLILEDDLYRAFSYKSLTVNFVSEKVAEQGEIPSDAEVLGETYLYTLSDGEPDRRFGSNPRLPEVLYGDLDLSAGGWKGMSVRVSKESAAAQFVLAFIGDQDPERHEHRRGVRPAEGRGQPNKTHEVLGVPAEATKVEITAAYRRMARTYHPDKTANFLPEFRDLADQRMKDVNAAYAKLRRTAN